VPAEGIFAGIIFQIGILDDDDVAAHLGQAAADRCPLAAVGAVLKQADVACLGQFFQHRPGAVGGAVVYGDNLFAERHGLHLFHDLPDGAGLVVDRHDHRHHIVGGDATVGVGQ